jgi:hypothetical protein
MPFKFNPLTGNLDLVGSSSSGSGVTRVGPTTDKAITRWLGTSADTIQDSKTKVQDGGAIEAQGFITRRNITDTVRVDPGNSWITPSIQLELTGAIELELDGEVIIV